jgi:ParB family transcriptional regulator, chromosome partitioning protein
MPKLFSKSRSISVVTPGFIEDIDISHIQESQNIIRRNEANLQDLCSSIQQKGLLQPVPVRTLENHYETVAGNRRFRACKSLRWKKVACHIIELGDKMHSRFH